MLSKIINQVGAAQTAPAAVGRLKDIKKDGERPKISFSSIISDMKFARSASYSQYKNSASDSV